MQAFWATKTQKLPRVNKPFYITTAIDYVNGHPHIGHAYEKIIADTIARAHRSMGTPTWFLTGTDEHGQKVQQAAISKDQAPQVYCDELAVIWQGFASKLGLSNDDFVRTTQQRHIKVVQAVLAKLHDEGNFYKAEHDGWYSTKEETFLTEKERRPDGTFDPIYGEVIRLKEENYYFKLKEHQQWLIEHIETHPDFIFPESRRNEVLAFLTSGPLGDLCISRPAARLKWGIPLPFDHDFVTYVWFDALLNYISVPIAAGDPGVPAAYQQPQQPGHALWPADIQVIGKDILKFHAVYWPIMLKAMGMPLPKQILVHGWWQKNHQKIAKSTGNVVDPVAIIDSWGLDAFRYYILRELDIGPDGNWTDEGFAARYNAELANGLGNLVQRSLTMVKRYRDGVVPQPQASPLAQEADRVIAEVQLLLTRNKLQGALQAIWELIAHTDRYIEQAAPFKIARDSAQAQKLDEILYGLAETCRVLAILINPFLPSTSARIHSQLGFSGNPEPIATARWGGLRGGHRIGSPEAIFPRRKV
jgi:methionyl-tRNA synthetase